MMKLSNYLILSLLIHSLIIISSESKCQHSFPCGGFTLEFPFTEATNPDCGFFMVDGCNSTQKDPRVRLQLAGGIRYDLLRVGENDMSVRDTELQKLLKESSYFAPRNVSLSLSLSLSLTAPDLTYELTSMLNLFAGSSNLLVLILAISGVVILFLLCCLLISYIIWLRKKRVDVGYLPSATISLGPLKSDIGVGSSFFGIPIFSYTQLEAATDSFDPSRELGDGGFGTVYYGKLLDGREVAIKRLYEQNCRRVEQFMNEIKILTSLKHPNLVCLYGCTSRRSRELLLVYEYVHNGTVADHLHGERADAAPLTWPIRMRIAIETATALAYLHKSDIIHRDVKTDNILLDKNYVVKVADFGLSRLFPNAASHISTAPGGTPGYIDPDYHQCYQVTDKSDVYSFGVVLVELISSMRAVDVSRRTDEINLANLAVTRIQRCAFDELIDPSLGYNTDAEVTQTATSVAEIAFRCLQQEEIRPSMAEVLASLKDI